MAQTRKINMAGVKMFIYLDIYQRKKFDTCIQIKN